MEYRAALRRHDGLAATCALFACAWVAALLPSAVPAQAAVRLTIASSVSGFLLMRVLAWLRPLRPMTSRWHEEQALIGRWLAAIAGAAKRDPGLALEIALCGRLIKGYGETHRRGKGNFLRILDTLVDGDAIRDPQARAQAIRAAREGALADPEGRKLEQSLETHGIAPLPPKPKPMKFMRRPRSENRKAA